MRICQECGKRCKKKFRIRYRYNSKDRYHKLLIVNNEYIVTGLVIICQECMNWSEERTFCGLCLDINPLCGFHEKNPCLYVGACNDCINEKRITDNYDQLSLDIHILSLYIKYRQCDVCSRICNEEIIKKEDIKDKNKLHAINELSDTDKNRHKYICERCFKWKEKTNIYCSICGTKKGKFVSNTTYPSVCLKCKQEQNYTQKVIEAYTSLLGRDIDV